MRNTEEGRWITLGLGNPDPDLIAAVSPAWVHLRRSPATLNLLGESCLES